jgi:hypothetical protein
LTEKIGEKIELSSYQYIHIFMNTVNVAITWESEAFAENL